MRHRFRTIAAALLVLAALLAWAGWRAWRDQRLVTEYGGQCGLARRCRVDGLGLTRSCEPRPEWNDQNVPAFAPWSACGDDWVPTVARVGPPGHPQGIGDYGGGGELVVTLATVRSRWGTEQERETLTRMLRDGEWNNPGMTAPYRVGTCGGVGTDLALEQPRVAIAGNLDGDPELDCWVLREDGTIRHVVRD